MAKTLLSISRLVKRFGGVSATDSLSLDVAAGETHALIGPNGAGKSTVIGQLQGELLPDEGKILFDDRDITREPAHRRASLGIARSFQITSIFPRFTVLANVVMAVQCRSGLSFRFFRPAMREAQLLEPAWEALRVLGLEHRAAVEAENLSHGERRQLELAMALATRPRLLLLDEPMAGMGRADGARMTRLLSELKNSYTILLVEHDMNAVFTLADRVSVLVAGKAIATGTPDEIRSNPLVKSAYLGRVS
ncbi:ABC transporter ATP-binding protein [Rhizobium sp. P28RR-XV]|uniref:ABC transporter ATP-binding protein n=1 Tax=Rhizobium sp. P28RR-XV TaxID=2726737 RepID=UPI0014569AFF|nr:ABC transporter ATP-binding protein [Rhizobium sp. P28RR-XV]NLR88193.1 ABC transporter ATP-binding protein [Rhizobium sp. P28RR-XV]